MRHSLPGCNLWRAAAAAFNAVVAAGLPAVNIAYVNRETPAPQDAWPALAEAFSALLLGPQSQPVSAGDESTVRAGILMHPLQSLLLFTLKTCTTPPHLVRSPVSACACLIFLSGAWA